MAAYSSKKINTSVENTRKKKGAQLIDETLNASGACQITRLGKSFNENSFVLLAFDSGEGCWCNIVNAIDAGCENGSIERDIEFPIDPSLTYQAEIKAGKFTDFKELSEMTEEEKKAQEEAEKAAFAEFMASKSKK